MEVPPLGFFRQTLNSQLWEAAHAHRGAARFSCLFRLDVRMIRDLFEGNVFFVSFGFSIILSGVLEMNIKGVVYWIVIPQEFRT